MFSSKLKEALLCLRAGRVTLPYPFVPQAPPEGFRGKPEIDGELCVGCGTCAMVCPPRLITLADEGEYRVLTVDYTRCTYCARCEEVCPEGAIKMSNNFETATNQKDDLLLQVKMKLARCSRCNRPFATQRLVKKMAQKTIGDQGSGDTVPAWVSWCPDCRQKYEARILGRLGDVEDD
ncbi:MAG: 4Fe-4S binding protein [Syntrophomonadaceae bacterium]|nr:4Fe-4S binding protein [Syntrophomonadaceae bacterium]